MTGSVALVPYRTGKILLIIISRYITVKSTFTEIDFPVASVFVRCRSKCVFQKCIFESVSLVTTFCQVNLHRMQSKFGYLLYIEYCLCKLATHKF